MSEYSPAAQSVVKSLTSGLEAENAELRGTVERLETELKNTKDIIFTGAYMALNDLAFHELRTRAEQAEAEITEMEESISNDDLKRAWKRVNALTAQSNKLFYQFKQAEAERDELRRQVKDMQNHPADVTYGRDSLGQPSGVTVRGESAR